MTVLNRDLLNGPTIFTLEKTEQPTANKKMNDKHPPE
jgi:hypothetical protein